MPLKNELMKKILMVFVGAAMVLASCGESVQTSSVETQEETKAIAANAEIDLKIEGMMCEKNCAGKIKEEIGSLSGVASCEIDFENKTAHVKYDDKLTNEDDISATIEKVNDGAYKVVTEKIEEAEVEEAEVEEETEVNMNAGDILKVSNLIGLLTSLVFDVQ